MIRYNSKYYKNPEAIASELIHEASHAVYGEDNPRSTGNSVAQEVYTNTNQLRFYEERTLDNPDYSDKELSERLVDMLDGKLKDNIRRRYGPDFPEY